MAESGQPMEIESAPLQQVAEALRQTRPFAETDPKTYLAALGGVDRVDRIKVSAGVVLVEPGEQQRFYWVVLEGEIRAERPELDGSRTVVGAAGAGEGFGEAPLLTGKDNSPMRIVAVRDSLLLRFTDQQFWTLLASSPAARKVILANGAQRMQAYQVEALHREKLISLGTLAAGLMHELNNPGAAAKRAASQLRENMLRLQQLSLRFSDRPKTAEQLECMRSLLEHAFGGCHPPALSSLAQADAEEAMAEWLHSTGVENAFTIAPALVATDFPLPSISDAI